MKLFILSAVFFWASCTGEMYFNEVNVRIQDPEHRFLHPYLTDTGAQVVDSAPDIIDEPEPELPTFLPFASSGTRCINGVQSEYLILSDEPVHCAAHALAVDAFLQNKDTVGYVVFDKKNLKQNRKYCFYDVSKGCIDVDFSVQISGTSGSWTGEIERSQTQPFSIEACDFDAIFPPSGDELPASDISIEDIAIYQSVRIPIYSRAQFVENPPIPIIAQRPGILRVFVNTEETWIPHEIIARLKIGNFQKEIRVTPTQTSTEADETSTLNFEFAKGEFPGTGTFSLKLVETELCSTRPRGEVLTYSIPKNPTELKITSYSRPLKVVLIPIKYNGDGSGRVPDVGKNVLEGFRNVLYAYFPVADIEMTALKDPLAYDGELQANGGGFAKALNFCLSKAPQKVGDADLFYCVFKPADSFGAFCGGRCVAGMAPVSGRGGMGIDFGGTGTETFAHELGHAAGRRHSPCGGASGADPNYPHAGGSIGTIGYSFASKRYISPTSAKDFMGYCRPNWVSDYTYKKLYSSLRGILGAQQFIVTTPPTTWKTAIYDFDQQLEWDRDRVLRSLPSGQEIKANAFDKNGKSVSPPRIFLTEVGDLNVSIFVIEEPTISVSVLEIPGYGRLRF